MNITKVGHFGGTIYAAELSGNYAYIGQGSYFVMFDINNKSAPVEEGRVETSGYIRDIELAGNNAYMADDYHGGLEIFRIGEAPPNRPPPSITNLTNKTFAQNYINFTWTNPPTLVTTMSCSTSTD